MARTLPLTSSGGYRRAVSRLVVWVRPGAVAGSLMSILLARIEILHPERMLGSACPVKPGRLQLTRRGPPSFRWDRAMISLDRRQFLHAALASTLAAPQKEPPMPIIDTHQHLWDLKKFRLSWIEKGSALDR